MALVCAVAAASPDAGAQAVAEAGEPADAAALRSLWSTLDAMWNARDAERFGALFTADSSFGFVDRDQSLESRATIRRHFAEQFATFAPDLRHRTSVGRIRVVAAGVRTADGKVEILRLGSAQAPEPSVLKTFAIFAVMLQTTEGWRIRVLRAYELPATAGGPAGR
jgi:uncharacterized protein (TIGR02246 family)